MIQHGHSPLAKIPQGKVFSFLKNGSALDISMYGVLYGDWHNGSEEAELVNAIRACAPTDSITLHINSEGGDMFAGIAIRNLLESHPGNVTCIVEGLAASAASIAAMAGRTVMRNGSMMMIHNPWSIVAGDADAMRSAADMLDKSRETLVAIYSEKTGKTDDELKALLSAETWMTAQEAIDEGFADDMDDDDEALDVVAVNRKRISINNVAFARNKVPPQILAMARTETQSPESLPMKTVFAALSLRDSATEADVLASVSKLSDERKQLLALTGKESTSEAFGVLAGWKESASEVQAVRAEVAKQKADQEARDFDAEVSAAKKSGILAASDDHKRNKQALSYKGKTDALVSLRGFLGALDPLVNVASDKPAAGSEPQTAVGGVIALTDEEKRIADKFGTPHELVLKNKARRLSLASKPVVNFEDEDAA